MNCEATLLECFDLFQNAKYIECKCSLSAIRFVNQIPQWWEWARDNNVLICDIMWDIIKTSVVKNVAAEGIRRLLHKLQAFPSSCEVLVTELSVVYNYTVIGSIEQRESRLPDVDVRSAIVRTFKRVLQYVQPQCGVIDEDIIEIMKQCLGALNLTSVKLFYPIVHLGCLWGTLQLHCGKVDEAHRCLQVLSSACWELTKLSSMQYVACTFPYGPSSTVVHEAAPGFLHLKQWLQFLLGLCLCLQRKWKECREHLMRVKFPAWLPYTKYIQGLSLYEEEKYEDCVLMLEDTFRHAKLATDSKIQSAVYNLSGTCLAKLSKPQCAVQKYRAALDSDFEILAPLYKISQQYRQLGLFDAELESLNLLVTALENTETVSQPAPFNLLEKVIFGVGELWNLSDISLCHAQYALAKRCLELKRYDTAAERYLALLAYMNDASYIMHTEEQVVTMPPTQKVYHEAVFSLLCAGQYEDCIIICDRLLSCHSAAKSSQTENSEPSFIENSEDLRLLSDVDFTRKRPRSDSVDQSITMETGCPLAGLEVDVIALMYKADALMHLGKFETASDSLHSAIQNLQVCPEIFSPREPVSKPEVEPKAKRQRLNTDIVDSTHHDAQEKTAELNGSASKLLARAYSQMGVSCVRQGKHGDSLHCLRISLQLTPDNLQTAYNLTAALWGTGSHYEAAVGWLEKRSIGIKGDTFQLGNELKRKQNLLRSSSSCDVSEDIDVITDFVTEEQLLQLDVKCLDFLLRHRQQQTRSYR